MAIAFAHLTSDATESAATSFTTASVTPTSNALQLLVVAMYRSDSVDVSPPTVTGCGLTWVQVDTGNFDTSSASRRGGALFRALGASPSSGTLTIDFAGVTYGACSWSLAEATGVDTSGTNGSGAIVQEAKTVDTVGGTSTSVTLAAFSDANNATFGGCVNEETWGTAGTGFTLLGTALGGTKIVGAATEYQLANDTTVTINFTSSRSTIFGVEVKVAATTVRPRSLLTMGVGS